MAPKLEHFVSYAITSSNINRFSNLFHYKNQKNICNNTVTKHSTTPQVCLYTTLWNVNVLKATIIENKITSVKNTFQECVVQQQGAHIEHLMLKLQEVTVTLEILIETINTLFPVVIFFNVLLRRIKLRRTKSVPGFGPPGISFPSPWQLSLRPRHCLLASSPC